MPPISIIIDRLYQVSVGILLFLIPGLISLSIGIKIGIKGSTVLIVKNYSQKGWSRPLIVKGKKALYWAKIDIAIGLFLIGLSLLIVLSVFLR
jgi:hypothetical protein